MPKKARRGGDPEARECSQRGGECSFASLRSRGSLCFPRVVARNAAVVMRFGVMGHTEATVRAPNLTARIVHTRMLRRPWGWTRVACYWHGRRASWPSWRDELHGRNDEGVCPAGGGVR